MLNVSNEVFWDVYVLNGSIFIYWLLFDVFYVYCWQLKWINEDYLSYSLECNFMQDLLLDFLVISLPLVGNLFFFFFFFGFLGYCCHMDERNLTAVIDACFICLLL
jgi:hypothetical protein